jgi:hypothetical protein
MAQTNISALVGKRVLVETSRGERAGIARYVRIGGDEAWLVVDLDGGPLGYGVHPDHVIGPEPGHASLWSKTDETPGTGS